jgi:hypothetical protein
MADVAQPQPMLSSVAGRVWWTLVLRGAVAVLFGLAALFWPGKTLFVLILFFGAYTLVDGIFAIVGGIMDSSRRWLLIIEGVLGVVAGLILLAWPGRAGVALRYRDLGRRHRGDGDNCCHLAQAGDRQRVVVDTRWLSLGSLRAHPGFLARGWAPLPHLADRRLRNRFRGSIHCSRLQGQGARRKQQGQLG